MDEVRVVEASLTVVLDIMHPPWNLEERRGMLRGRLDASRRCASAGVGANSRHAGNARDRRKKLAKRNLPPLELS